MRQILNACKHNCGDKLCMERYSERFCILRVNSNIHIEFVNFITKREVCMVYGGRTVKVVLVMKHCLIILILILHQSKSGIITFGIISDVFCLVTIWDT